MTGALSEKWSFDKFSPWEIIPSTVKFTVYGGGSMDITTQELQQYVDLVEKKEENVTIDSVYTLQQMVEAHEHMEANKAKGKVVCVTDEKDLPKK